MINKFFATANLTNKKLHKLTISLIVLAILAAIITYIYVTYLSSESGPLLPKLLIVIAIDGVLLALLLTLGSRYMRQIWYYSTSKSSRGIMIQRRIVVIFSLSVAIPTLLIATFAIAIFDYGVNAWFDERINSAVKASSAIADGYLSEHKNNIRADAIHIAHEVEHNFAYDLDYKQLYLSQFLTNEAEQRGLMEALIFKDKTVVAHSQLSFAGILDAINQQVINEAAQGGVVIISDPTSVAVRALIKLHYASDSYLIIGRFVDQKLLDYVNLTKAASQEYQNTKNQLSQLQLKFITVFMLAALMILISMILYGILFSAELVQPIAALVNATNRVTAGDLSTRVKERENENEFALLSRGFNLMVSRLSEQQDDLIKANKKIEQRRKFIEQVISEISAGIIVIGNKGAVKLINKAALQILQLPKTRNQNLANTVPKLFALSQSHKFTSSGQLKTELQLQHHGITTEMMVKISRTEDGIIFTFEDISSLVQAKRQMAWQGVARRVAHEIKNPLTPISLAAQRLKQKYSKQIQDQQYDKYLETISKHVETMSNIVNEFVNFARLPSPKFAQVELGSVIASAVFSQQTSFEKITYNTTINEKIKLWGDQNQLQQAFENLLLNAAEAIDQNNNGQIEIKASKSKHQITICISDNGSGFPHEIIDRLTEPYITTRERGTGLGLAIVHKIISDHNGHISFANRSQGGAIVNIFLPAIEKAK